MDRRKLLVGLALGALVIVLGVALYFVFFRGAPAEPITPPPVNLVPINAPPFVGPGLNIAPPPINGAIPVPPVTNVPLAPTIPRIATGGRTIATPLTATPAQFTAIRTDGTLRYYDPSSGRFFRIGADGTPTPLSDRTFPNIRNVAWSPRDERGVIEFPDGANILYDFRTETQVTLPAHWGAFSFAPTGDRIAGKSIALDRENRWLFEADPDGSNYRAVEPLGTNADRVDVAWSPNNHVIAFARTGDSIGGNRQQILLIGRNGENFPGLVVEGQQFQPQWSPSGSRILYSAVSASNEYKPELWAVDGSGDAIGGNRTRLRIDTWAEKCAFATDTTVFCAIPDRLERGYGLEPALAERSPDSIERIDLTTGMRTVVGRPDIDTSIGSMHVDPTGRSLYYTSKRDGRLYEMRLK